MKGSEFFKLISLKTKAPLNYAKKIYLKYVGKEFDYFNDEEISSEIIESFAKIYDENSSYPYEYVLGYIDSFGFRFELNTSVLIPRQETEYLIQYIYEKEKHNKNLKILDICTGSGYIAISLSRLSHSKLIATDISHDALAIAKRNANNNGVEIEFLQGSYLEPLFNMNEKYDLITCNPPYIAYSDDFDKSILVEPELALFVENPLEPYEIILADLDKFLNKSGTAYIEISSLHHNEYERLKNKYTKFNIEFMKDYSQKYRYMIVKFKD